MILSAGVIPVRLTDAGPRVLLLRIYRYWDFPKGEVEPGEDPFAAALREVREETGLSDLGFPWGREYHETPPYSRGKIARYYVGHTSTTDVILGMNPETGKPEHQEYRWVSPQRAYKLLNERVGDVLSWGQGRLKV